MINLIKRNSVRVFWFSRHDPTPEQLDGLRRYACAHFDCLRRYACEPILHVEDVVIRKVDMTAADGKAAAALWRGEPVIVAVMPPAMLSEFVDALPTAALSDFINTFGHEPSAGPLASAHILLPRSKRERTPDGGVSFVYDGFDRVLECRFRVEHVG